jgi:hydroxypyruvate isomerase
MPKFAANLSMLFTELPFIERFAAAKSAGFEAVEYLFPYAWDKKELAAALKTNGLIQVLHNLPAGNWEAGDRGVACDPARVAEFRASVPQGIEYATALGCPQINCLAGKLPAGVNPETARSTLIANLKFAAAGLKKANLKLLMEPINYFDIPGFFVNRTDQALAILDDVGSDNLFVQYDIYHAQRMEGELGNNLKNHLARIGHIQLADNPGRHEPGTGEINYSWLFKHLDAIGYTGWIGCEYKPKTNTVDGLGWIKALN